MSNLTRIKNNQITDSTIWANAKIVPGSIVGSLFSSNITVTSDFVITGNLYVAGASTYLTVASTNTFVNDPLIVLNNAYSAGAIYDIGFIFERGTDDNQAFYWDETSDEFKLIATSEGGSTYGNIGTEISYSNFRLGNLFLNNYSATRSLFVGASGLVTTDAEYTYDATNNTLTVGQFLIVGNSAVTIQTTGTDQDLKLAPSGAGIVDFNGTNATNLADPVSGSDAVTLTYLNNQLSSAVTNLIDDDTEVRLIDDGVNAGQINANVDATSALVIKSNSLSIFGTGYTGSSPKVFIDSATSNVAISSTLWVSDVVTLNSTVPASSYTTGAVKVSGGVGIGGNLYVGAGIQDTIIGNVTPNAGFFTNLNATGNLQVATVNASFLSASTAVVGNIAAVTIGNTGAVVQGLTAQFSGNVIGGLAQFAALNATPIGNAAASTGAFTTLTASSVNSSGNVLGAAATFSSSQINGNENVTGYLNVTGNILGSAGTLSTLDLNSTTNATDATGTTGALQVSGGVSIAKDVWIGGNLFVSNIFGVTEQLIAVADPLLYLTASNTFPYTYDIGFFSHFTGGAANIEIHTGFVRDASDGYWKLFSNVDTQPTSVITFNGTEDYDGLKLGNLQLTATGTAISAAGFINTTANISGAVVNAGALNVTGTTTLAAINSTGLINTTGNVSAATVIAGQFNTTGNLVASEVSTGTLNATGLINTTGNISAAVVNGGAINSTGLINTTGNVSAATVIAGQFNTTGNLVASQVSTGTLNATGLINTTGNVSAATVIAGQFNTTGNLVASEVSTGTLNATGLINTLGNVSAATVIAGQFNTTGNLVASQVSTGTLNATGLINTLGNISGARINADTLAATGTIWANASTDTTSLATGALIVAGGTAVGKTMWVGEGARINSTQSAESFHVLGQGTNNSLIYADFAKNAIVFGGANAAVQDGAVVKFNSPGAIVVPVGSTAQRPGSAGNVDVTGMLRFNNTSNNLEFYDGSDWTAAGSEFTVIATNNFSGNGVQLNFTLSSASTTAGTLVMINGVVQIPTTAYSVTGTTLTFTEAPASGDVIDARTLITTATVSTLASGSGYNTFDVANEPYANVTAGTSSAVTRLSIDGATGTATFTNDVVINGNLTVKGGSSGNINIGDQPTDKLQLQGSIVYNQTAINAPGTNLKELDSFSTSAFSTAKYLIQVKDGANIESAEVLLAQDTANVLTTTYAVLAPAGALGTFSSNIVGGAVKFWYTPSISTNANIKVQTTYIV